MRMVAKIWDEFEPGEQEVLDAFKFDVETVHLDFALAFFNSSLLPAKMSPPLKAPYLKKLYAYACVLKVSGASTALDKEEHKELKQLAT